MSPGRELTAAALLCGGGAALALLAAGQPWADPPGSLGGDGSSGATGAALAPIVPAASVGALTSLGAVVATRGRGRIAVGALLALLGLAVAAGAATAGGDVGGGEFWRFLAVAGGVSQAAAGAWTAVRGGPWPGLGARRHPAAHDERQRGGMWEALDRGEDPTL